MLIQIYYMFVLCPSTKEAYMYSSGKRPEDKGRRGTINHRQASSHPCIRTAGDSGASEASEESRQGKREFHGARSSSRNCVPVGITVSERK